MLNIREMPLMTADKKAQLDEVQNTLSHHISEILANRFKIIEDFCKAYLAANLPNGIDSLAAARWWLNNCEVQEFEFFDGNTDSKRIMWRIVNKNKTDEEAK